MKERERKEEERNREEEKKRGEGKRASRDGVKVKKLKRLKIDLREEGEEGGGGAERVD